MSDITTKSPRRRRRGIGALTGFAVLLAAAVIGAGSAAASPHYSPSHGSWPGSHGHTGGPGTPPQQPVPGTGSSDPTQLAPPPIDVLTNTGNTSPGSIFIAPKPGVGTTTLNGQEGPEIIDNQGRPIWFQPINAPYTATDFRVQTYRGQPVLTYNVGQSSGGPGHSEGEGVILNRHYQQIATVSAGNGLMADQHEFALTPQGTALITIYKQVPYDLSAVGGPANGSVLDGVVQEIDVATGKVLFEWDSLSHVPLSDSYQPVPTAAGTPYDYFHINSVNLDSDGNLLISSRHTWTVYKVDRHSGSVIWRLGGKESDFQEGPGVHFAWQHNALPEVGQPNTIRIFDNGSNVTGLPGVPGSAVNPESRVIDVHLDTQSHTATLVNQVTHPEHLSSGSQGNAERLPGGGLFVGWGQIGRFSEFDASGNLVWDGQVPAGYDTYRAYRSPWVGEPLTDPTAVATASAPGQISVDAIWNGATKVSRWVVLGGQHRWALHPVTTTAWNGLSTEIDTSTRSEYVAVVALDDHGRPIGHSPTVRVGG